MSSTDSPPTPGPTGAGRGHLPRSQSGPARAGGADLSAQLQTLQEQQLALAQLVQQAAVSSNETPPATTPQIAAVSVKLPDFWPSDPALWFARAESMFNTRGITQQQTKFDHVAYAISNEYATEIRDILMQPPPSNPYDVLKVELIRRLQSSEQRRLRQLLTEEELGDRKPSQLLRRMQQLAGTNQLDDAMLRELFLQRLPTSVKLVLAAAPDSMSLGEQAAMADRVLEATQSSVNAVQPHMSSLSALEHKLAELTTTVSDLVRTVHSRGRSASRSGRSTPATSPSRSQHDLCFYHRKFGDKARKCSPPCSMHKQEN